MTVPGATTPAVRADHVHVRRVATRRRQLRLGTAPLLAVIAACGLILVALGDSAARNGTGGSQPLFWGGLVLIYTPIAMRLLAVSASREERIALSLLLGSSLYLVKVLYSPTGYTLHDELATWRQTYDLIITGHPLSFNPLVSGYAGFPGLELLTSALSILTGLRIFIAGTIVIGLSRVVLMLAIFLFLEKATRSARAAGIGVAIYVSNPSFLYFDSQFGYESLALVVGASLLLISQLWTEGGPIRARNLVGTVAAMTLVTATLAITHHMTSYAITAFLLLWALVIAVTPESGKSNGNQPRDRLAWLKGPALPGLLLAAAAAIWFAVEASHVTTAELGSVFTDAAESVINLIVGNSGSKTLFQSAGQANSTAAKLLGVASVVPFLVIIPIGLWKTWRGHDRNPLWRTLAIVAALFPITLLLRLTQAGTETSQRASEFVYLGLAFVGAALIVGLSWSGSPVTRVLRLLGFGAIATVVFIGGFIVGESPLTRQPGPFMVGAEARSLSPQGLAAAKFAVEHLPRGSRVLVDRPNSTLLSSYGGLDRVGGSIDDIPVARVFFSEEFDAVDQRIISDDEIEFIVVDRRLSHEPPAGGYYFESTEARANHYREPIPVRALRKFNHVKGLSRIFDNGAIAIYDTSGIRSR